MEKSKVTLAGFRKCRRFATHNLNARLYLGFYPRLSNVVAFATKTDAGRFSNRRRDNYEGSGRFGTPVEKRNGLTALGGTVARSEVVDQNAVSLQLMGV